MGMGLHSQSTLVSRFLSTVETPKYMYPNLRKYPKISFTLCLFIRVIPLLDHICSLTTPTSPYFFTHFIFSIHTCMFLPPYGERGSAMLLPSIAIGQFTYSAHQYTITTIIVWYSNNHYDSEHRFYLRDWLLIVVPSEQHYGPSCIGKRGTQQLEW